MAREQKPKTKRAVHALTRSEFSAQVDAIKTASRADVARKASEGKSWEGICENVALLGIDAKRGKRPKMIFGRGR